MLVILGIEHSVASCDLFICINKKYIKIQLKGLDLQIDISMSICKEMHLYCICIRENGPHLYCMEWQDSTVGGYKMTVPS